MPKGVSELTVFLGSSDGRLGRFPQPKCSPILLYLGAIRTAHSRESSYCPVDFIPMAIFLCQGSRLPTPSSLFWMAL